jgi:hypothetical protein
MDPPGHREDEESEEDGVHLRAILPVPRERSNRAKQGKSSLNRLG